MDSCRHRMCYQPVQQTGWSHLKVTQDKGDKRMHTWIPYIAPFVLLAVVILVFIFGKYLLSGDRKDLPLFSYERRKLTDEAVVLIAQSKEARVGEALAYLEAALERAERVKNLHLITQINVERGNALMLQRRFSEAIDMYELVLSTSPSWQGENPNLVLQIERELLRARAEFEKLPK